MRSGEGMTCKSLGHIMCKMSLSHIAHSRHTHAIASASNALLTSAYIARLLAYSLHMHR